ncbi:hypothetical protein [Allomuricauda sp. M10]|uniref:hypothetical protein n=1 Tax=Allomuricauda sp. M10 TaxID=2683292 RepID=UPI001D189E00|nr:hypothetical protein [Muricauda sp. M10]
MKRIAVLAVLMLTSFLAMGQASFQYQRHGKKTSAEIALIDVSNTNYVYTATDIDLGIEVINWSDGNGWIPRNAGGGGIYTAGNGLNLSGSEFSVDSTRVILLDVDSPLTGPAQVAFGTNAALDLLPAPDGYKRYEFATDGVISGGGSGVTDHGLLTGLLDDDHTQYHNDARALAWLNALYPNLDTDATDDFDGSWANITGKPVNLDVDSTDDFDGVFSSLSGIPAGLDDGDDDTIADGSETKVNAGSNVNITGLGTAASPYVINATDTNTQLTSDQVKDIVSLMVNGNTETGISVTYQTSDKTIDFVLSTEYLQDLVGAMISGNTENNITVTYNDTTGKLDFNVPEVPINVPSTPFVPTLTGSGGDTFSYTVYDANYTRSGDIVTVNMWLTNITGTATSSTRIGNLPYTSDGYNVIGDILVGDIDVNFYSVHGIMTDNTSYITLGLQSAYDGSNDTTQSNLTFSNGDIRLTATYIAN